MSRVRLFQTKDGRKPNLKKGFRIARDKTTGRLMLYNKDALEPFVWGMDNKSPLIINENEILCAILFIAELFDMDFKRLSANKHLYEVFPRNTK